MVEETYSDVTEADQSPQLDYQSTETIINPVLNSSHRALVNILKQLYKFDSSEQKSGIWRQPSQTLMLWCTDPFWCHSVRLTNGEATCSSPRGARYRSTLGSRCEMKCDRGYKLLGRSSIQCLQSRRWSGTAFCRSTCKLWHWRGRRCAWVAAAAACHPSSSAVSEMRCRVLHLIPHGRYTCTRGFEADSRCDFTCSPGYRFEGEHSRTCLPGGSWSGVQPVCTGE